MKKRTFILGAGASCSYIESPTKLIPPLAKEIIKRYHQLKIAENRLVLVGDLVNYVRDFRDIMPFDFANFDEDIESFLSEIESKLYDVSALINNQNYVDNLKQIIQLSKTYDQLIFLITSIFNEIQNGPISDTYLNFIRNLTSNDNIITFNWDTLMDKALYQNGNWSPSDGYFIEPESIFKDGWQKTNSFSKQNSFPTFLKLHGSTNWLTPYHSINFETGDTFSLSSCSINKLFVFLSASKKYETYAGRYWGDYKPFSYCYYPPNLPVERDPHPQGLLQFSFISAYDLSENGKIRINDRNTYSMPLIIPPVKGKQYMRYGDIFAKLWNRAKEAIINTEELYIIGYSIPKTDTESKKLLLDALSRNINIEKIVIVNPSPDSVVNYLMKEIHISKNKIKIYKEKFSTRSDGQFSFLN